MIWHQILLNPFLGALVVKIYQDLVLEHGFFTFRIFFFRHPKVAGSKIFYTNLIISSEKLFSMPPLMGRLRDPAVPGLDF